MKCFICLSNISEKIIEPYLDCNCNFHFKCIDEWKKKFNYCPQCNKNFKQKKDYIEDEKQKILNNLMKLKKN